MLLFCLGLANTTNRANCIRTYYIDRLLYQSCMSKLSILTRTRNNEASSLRLFFNVCLFIRSDRCDRFDHCCGNWPTMNIFFSSGKAGLIERNEPKHRTYYLNDFERERVRDRYHNIQQCWHSEWQTDPNNWCNIRETMNEQRLWLCCFATDKPILRWHVVLTIITVEIGTAMAIVNNPKSRMIGLKCMRGDFVEV